MTKNHDKESTEGTYEFFDATFEYGEKKGLGHSMERQFSFARGADGMATSKEERTRWLSGSPQPMLMQYQRKIKEAFNPNDLGDNYYRFLEEPDDK